MHLRSACMSPALNGSSAIRRYEYSDTIEIRDRITFDFYTGMPHIACGGPTGHMSYVLMRIGNDLESWRVVQCSRCLASQRNIPHLCDLQTAFMWPLKATCTCTCRWKTVINKIGREKIFPNPSEPSRTKAWWWPEIAVEPMECTVG